MATKVDAELDFSFLVLHNYLPGKVRSSYGRHYYNSTFLPPPFLASFPKIRLSYVRP